MHAQASGRRICLFGGTFDPIHCAHLEVANEALAKLALNRVVFVPAANPPHKAAESVTPYEDRFRMVEIACAPYPAFEASRLEAGPEKSYTIETVTRFREELAADDRLLFLIGADAFDEIGTWKRWREVVAMVEFIVVSRPGKEYRTPEGARVLALYGLHLPVSSSEIRQRLSQGEEVAEVPAAVREYIARRGLYGRHGEPMATASPS